jgi:predicted DNA binding CopG/RHH family protein
MTKEVKDKFITVRLPESLLNKLRDKATENDRTIAAQVLHYIKQGMSKAK